MANKPEAHVCCSVRPDEARGDGSGCPGCGKEGQPVSAETVRHLVQENLARQVEGRDFKFCRTPDCSIVYYPLDDGSSITKDALRVRVGLKETEDPVWVCYCFEISERMIREEIEKTGRSTAADRIRREVKAGTCECEIRNPSGRCCLGDVRAVEKRCLEASERTRGGIAAAKTILLAMTIVSLLMMGTVHTVPALARDEGAKVTVQVDGLSCPFCAFGLEKKLKKIDGVKAVTIKVDQGMAEVIFIPGSVIDQNKIREIREAVKAGGFTPRDIRVLKPETGSPVP